MGRFGRALGTEMAWRGVEGGVDSVSHERARKGWVPGQKPGNATNRRLKVDKRQSSGLKTPLSMLDK